MHPFSACYFAYPGARGEKRTSVAALHEAFVDVLFVPGAEQPRASLRHATVIRILARLRHAVVEPDRFVGARRWIRSHFFADVVARANTWLIGASLHVHTNKVDCGGELPAPKFGRIVGANRAVPAIPDGAVAVVAVPAGHF